MTEHERPWKDAIVRRMRSGCSERATLPSLEEVESQAGFGAITTSMRVAWLIAAEAGLIDVQEYRRLIAAQLDVIDRALGLEPCTHPTRETLTEMRVEYRYALNG